MPESVVERLDLIFATMQRQALVAEVNTVANERHAKAVEEQEKALSLILAALQAIVPTLETHTEMLRLIMEMAGESEDGAGEDTMIKRLNELIEVIKTCMQQQSTDIATIVTLVQDIPDQVESSAMDGVRRAIEPGSRA